MFRSITLLALLVIASPLAPAEISESELAALSGKFVARLEADNPESREAISAALDGIIHGDNTGILLRDKIGIFMHDIQKNNIVISRTRFMQSGDRFSLFIIFSDGKSGEYTLYLEYRFETKRKARRLTLTDAWFSLVYGEKKETIDRFFRYR